jgi:hypothetical protein
MPTTPKLTNEIVEAAIQGFEAQKQRIDAQIAELRALLAARPAATEPKSGKAAWKLSAAAKDSIREAQRLRWAKTTGEAVPAPASPKRRLSEAGRKVIIAATKKRWAAKRAETAATSAGRWVAFRKSAAKKAATSRRGTSGTGPRVTPE